MNGNNLENSIWSCLENLKMLIYKDYTCFGRRSSAAGLGSGLGGITTDGVRVATGLGLGLRGVATAAENGCQSRVVGVGIATGLRLGLGRVAMAADGAGSPVADLRDGLTRDRKREGVI